MSRHRLFVFLGSAALLFGLAMSHPYPRQSLFGPAIRGKPWCVWEAQVRRNLNWQAPQGPVVKVMRWLGVDQVPMEVDELYNHPEMVPLLLHLTEDPDPVIRRGAVGAFFWHTNLQDKSALPALRARLEDSDVLCRIDAAMAAATIDPTEPVLPTLVRILDDPANVYRENAIRAVIYMAGSDAGFDVLVRYAKDADPTIRREIMDVLADHGKKGIPTLILGLEDSDPFIRRLAVDSLAALGPDAKPAIAALERLLNDPDESVRDSAAGAMVTIDPKRFEHLKTKEK